MPRERETDTTRRVCKFCGKRFTAVTGQAKRRGCPECEPSLLNTPRAF